MSSSQEPSQVPDSRNQVDIAAPQVGALNEIGDQYLLSHESLTRTLSGVVVAVKLDDGQHSRLQNWLAEQRRVLESEPLSVNQWIEASRSRFVGEPDVHAILDLVIGIAYMRERGRHSNVSSDQISLNFIWPLIYAALTQIDLFKPSRSAVGFVWVPLCSLINDGAIDELWRLHVWLPDGQRGNPDFTVHGHHAFGQSWFLAGEGRNHRWAVEPTTDEASATHAEYRVAWDDGKKSDAGYKTHQVSSTITNSHNYYKATHLATELESRNMTYSVSHEEWHSSEVAPDIVAATLFFFDAHRGVNPNAVILGPKDGVSSTQLRDPAGNTPEKLVKTVEVLRKWEDAVASFKEQIVSSRSSAPEAFEQAKSICENEVDFPNKEYYKAKTLSEWSLAYSNLDAAKKENNQNWDS